MRPNLLCLLLSVVIATLALGGCPVYADQCLTCHDALDDEPAVLFKGDMHFQKGLSCANCHGGNPTAHEIAQAKSQSAGFLGVPRGDTISQTCAKCHASPEAMKRYNSALPTDQLALLQGSVHGKLSTTGTERIVQCTTCHRAHGIVSVKNPASPVYSLNMVKTCTKCHSNAAYMQTYNPALPVDQLDKYRTSVHGRLNAKGDPKPAACASCHGGHDIRPAADVKSRVYAANLPATCGSCHSNAEYMKGYGIPTDQVEKFTTSVHGVALLQKHDLAAPACNDCHGNHGAVPPGVESISKVCGTCHALNADLFSSSPHKKAFDQRHLPECETCHGNHGIVAATEELLGVTPPAVCSKCHHERESAKGYGIAKRMRQLIDKLGAGEQRALALVDQAEQKGMEIGEAKFKLRDARQARLESRTAIHAFNETKFREVVDKGLKVTSLVANQAQHAVDEYYFRRWGLGASTLIIAVVAASLYLLIRRIES